jgi:predicted TIM-barrel fold metal-dependent hydrolase
MSAAKSFMVGYTVVPQQIQESLITLLFSGVFERFPRLNFLSVENDIGWVPYLLQRMDHGAARKGIRRGTGLKSGVKPSEQFRRNVRCTFMEDHVGLANLGRIGPEMILWASDYPHDDSTWPHSQQVIAEQFAGLTPADREKIVFSNAVALYNMQV